MGEFEEVVAPFFEFCPTVLDFVYYDVAAVSMAVNPIKSFPGFLVKCGVE